MQVQNQNMKNNQVFFDGEALHYAQAVVLKNAFFNVSQKGRYEIISGINNKFAMASIDGELVSIEPPKEFDGIEIKFNPKLHHLFVDKESEAIKSAEEVVVFGHRAYARGKIEYYHENNMPKPIGNLPSEAKPAKKEFSVVYIQHQDNFKAEEQSIVKKQKKPSFA